LKAGENSHQREKPCPFQVWEKWGKSMHRAQGHPRNGPRGKRGNYHPEMKAKCRPQSKKKENEKNAITEFRKKECLRLVWGSAKNNGRSSWRSLDR